MEKVLAEEFASDLEANEESIGEMAAFAVTCEQHGISEEEGCGLFAQYAGLPGI